MTNSDVISYDDVIAMGHFNIDIKCSELGLTNYKLNKCTQDL